MQHRVLRAILGLALVAGLVVLVGCSAQSKLVPISGTLTVDGKPGSLATVTFWPSNPNAAIGGATVFTDDNGKFVSGDAKYRTGFEPGEYKVTVSRMVDSQGRPVRVSGKKSEAEFETPAVESIPAAYRDRNTTPLSIHVGHDSPAFALDVKKK